MSKPLSEALGIVEGKGLIAAVSATDAMAKLCADPETMPFPDALVAAIKPELNRVFKPAFLGRMVVIPYYPVRDEALKQIIRLKLGKIVRRLKANHRVDLIFEPALIDEVAKRCTEVESGARNIDRPEHHHRRSIDQQADRCNGQRLCRQLDRCDHGPGDIRG